MRTSICSLAIKPLICAVFILVCGMAFGQPNTRYDWNAQTINQAAPQPGGLYPVLAIPNIPVAICNAPANAVPCTNYATTFISAASGTTCPSNAQLTRPGSNTCVANTDSEAGFGAWLGGGCYQYTLTASYGSFGPYDFCVGAGSATPNPPAYSIQAANSTATGLTSDPNITINTTLHSLQVGPTTTNPGPTVGPSGSGTTNWRWYWDTPQTACASIGCVFNSMTVSACSYTGATADVQLAAALSAIPTGGTVNALCFGATKQTIAATVTVGATTSTTGYSGTPQSIVFDPATTFQPATATTQMFSLGIGSHVDGLTIYTGNVSNYSVPAIQYAGTNPSFFYIGAELTNTVVYGTQATSGQPAPTAGSACLSLVSSSSAQAIAFAKVNNFSCVGEYDGIYFGASSSGYVNGNQFSNVLLYNQVNSLEMNSTGSNGIQANTFSGLGMQWANLGATQSHFIYLHGSAALSIINNQFLGIQSWDAPANAQAYYLPDSSAQGNKFDGFLVDGFANNQIVDNSGNFNSFNDTNWQTWNYVPIPSILNSAGTNANLVPDSDFQYGWSYWGRTAPNAQWTISPAGDPYSLPSLHFAYNASPNTTPFSSTAFTVQPSTTYTFSFDFASNALVGTSEPNIAVIDASTSTIYGYLYPQNLNETAAQCLAAVPQNCRQSFLVTIPGGVTSVKVLVSPYLVTWSSSSGYIDFGGFQLTSGSHLYGTAPAYVASGIPNATTVPIFPSIIDTAVATSPSPICPNDTNGAFTTSGCSLRFINCYAQGTAASSNTHLSMQGCGGAIGFTTGLSAGALPLSWTAATIVGFGISCEHVPVGTVAVTIAKQASTASSFSPTSMTLNIPTTYTVNTMLSTTANPVSLAAGDQWGLQLATNASEALAYCGAVIVFQ